ncbi:serine/arginine-rich splicing factor 3-like [Oppia nitens]|uniref:serine/arginine-rich splicing factor 3-like n=1 Tax=Oppia nitens TaxID=1686743 RepID=UPI0023D99599|nr:serine/arginine-rich splicing factor 3-like [Oppia nitens]
MSNRYRNECPEGCKVFVGNLNRNTSRDDIRHAFSRFGDVTNVWLATNPPGFGFVMYDHRDGARLAVERMNNSRFDGRFLTVELATGAKRRHRSRSRSPAQRRHFQTDGKRSSRVNSRERVAGGDRRVSSSSDRFGRYRRDRRYSNSSSSCGSLSPTDRRSSKRSSKRLQANSSESSDDNKRQPKSRSNRL